MVFQSSIPVYNAAGVPGDMAFDGPLRATPYNLNSAGQAQVIGYAYTVNNGGNPNPPANCPVAGTAKVGGTGPFAGILVNSKEYANFGAGNNALAANFALPDNSIGTLANMGIFWVTLSNSALVGDRVYFNNTTGALTAVAPNSTFTGVVATNTLTVSGFVAGGAPLGVGSVISGTGVQGGTRITALGTGTGGNGTYTVDGNATVASTTMTSQAIAPAGSTLMPNTFVDRFDVSAAGLAVIKMTN